MLSGMVIPGDAVAEKDVESTEGASSETHLAEERLERGGRPESRSTKGVE